MQGSGRVLLFLAVFSASLVIAAFAVAGETPELASKYKEPKDLKGLKIATFPPGSIQYTILSKWLKENGLDPEKDVEIRTMGPREAISAIESGAVDAVFLPEPAPTIIELDGKGVRVVQSGEMYPNHACCCLLISGKLIREHPEIVEQIVRTHINATKYLKEHPEEAARIFSEKTGFDYEKTLASFERWDGDWITNPHEMMNSTLEYARVNYELGLAKRLLTDEDLFDTRFYDKIMGISSSPIPVPAEREEIKEIRIGYQPSTHQIAEMIAMEKGWWQRDLKRFGVENVTDKEFPSGPPEMNAMLAGEIDVAYVGTAPPITAIANSGLDAKIVAAVQINGSALVLRAASKTQTPGFTAISTISAVVVCFIVCFIARRRFGRSSR